MSSRTYNPEKRARQVRDLREKNRKDGTQELLNQIAAEMQKPRPNQKLLERLNKKLDQALGTELNPDDVEAGADWEDGRQD